MKKSEKYDIKEASNQNLSAKARKHYAENAQHNVKTGSYVSKHSKQK